MGESGKKNEPANVARIAKRLAQLKEIDEEELIAAVYANFISLFHFND